MKWLISQNGQILVLALCGRFDAHVVHEIDVLMRQLVDESALGLVINWEKTGFIDSDGLTCLMQVHKYAHMLGKAVINCHVPPTVAIIWELTQLDRFLLVKPDVSLACAYMSRMQSSCSDEVVVLTPDTPRLDAFNVANLERMIQSSIDGAWVHLILDLTEVEVLDSAALAVIVRMLKQLRRLGGDMKLVWPKHEHAKRIFELTQFDRVFAGFSTPHEAHLAFGMVRI